MHYIRLKEHGVYEYETPVERILRKTIINKKTGCWEYHGFRDYKGYGVVSIKCKDTIVHRYIYEYYYGKIPDGLLACHKCDNPSCCNPEHIFVGTINDNQKDAAIKGRLKRGEAHHNSKLSERNIFEIREDTRLQKIIAVDFNVKPNTISRIRSGKRWGWLK